LFQCKNLKRAALGRMATICKRLKDPLVYLEQVRQHLGRLPAIDPNTRTLVICGYPNVGKSSFLKGISRADVDVQPYAFTTKSLFVGHFDHPLEEMNTIEHQSICAIAHLRSAVLYFMDLSEQCGYTVAAQVSLFNSIRPLFANKLVFVVINKIDVTRPEDLDPETQALVQGMLKSGEVELLQLSCTTTEGLMNVRNEACDRLLAQRNAEKLKAGTTSSGEPTGRLGDLLRRIHVAQPMGGVTRETTIPDAVKNRKKYDPADPDRITLERDLEEEDGGAGVYNFNMRKNYILENPEWKEDRIPEVYDGKNVYDFIDPDIEAKLAALEEEEEKLEAEGFYESDDEVEDADEADIRYKAELIREKRQLIRNEAKMRKSLKNRAVIPRSAKAVKMSQMGTHLESLGFDTSKVAERARSQSRGRSLARARSEAADGDAMDVDTPKAALARALSRGRSASTNRRTDGVPGDEARSNAERLSKLGQKKMNRMARQGEADRHQTGSLIKHLVSELALTCAFDNANHHVACWQAWQWKDEQPIKVFMGSVVCELGRLLMQRLCGAWALEYLVALRVVYLDTKLQSDRGNAVHAAQFLLVIYSTQEFIPTFNFFQLDHLLIYLQPTMAFHIEQAANCIEPDGQCPDAWPLA
jgi:nucleolar GTP-binding protein